MTRVLLLGGTTQASALAQRLSSTGINAVFSYAGRTRSPAAQPLPTRIGGFGGVEGLCRYLAAEHITHIVDATHPFAAGMSQNAFAAAQATGVSLIRLERAAWTPQKGDNWNLIPTLENVPAHLPRTPATVFLAIGRQHIAIFAAHPQHHYILRLVDPPDGPLPLQNATAIIARGPFDFAGDLALLRDHKVTHIVAKNAGGTATRAKLDAARALGIPVLMVNRPLLPDAVIAHDVGAVLAHLAHDALRGV